MFWGGSGEAAAAGEGVATAEDEGFGEVGVVRAEREWGVVHEAVEEVRVAAAGRGDRGDVGVEEEIRWDGGL